jgi:hypothetical protein
MLNKATRRINICQERKLLSGTGKVIEHAWIYRSLNIEGETFADMSIARVLPYASMEREAGQNGLGDSAGKLMVVMTHIICFNSSK